MTDKSEIARQAFASARVDPNWLRSYIAQNAAAHGLAGVVPRDGARYGIRTGSPEEWANFMVPLAYTESGLKNSTVGDVGQFGTGSRGLFQLSIGDAPNYGLNGGRPFSHDQLADPVQNTNAALAIMSNLVRGSGSIQAGAGRYWGPIQRGWTPGGGQVPQGGSVPTAGAPAVAQPAGVQPQSGAPDPALVEWAMNSPDQGGSVADTLAGMFAGASRRQAVPQDAQRPVTPADSYVPAMPSPADYRLALPVNRTVVGDPLDVILAGVA